MRVVFVALYDAHSWGIRILHAILSKHQWIDVHSVFFKHHYSDEECLEQDLDILVDTLESLEPDAVCFGLRSNFFPLFKRLRRAMNHRAFHPTVIVGGHHATICPEDCAQFADYVIVGEGELAIEPLLKALWTGGDLRLRNIYGNTPLLPMYPLIDNLDSVPYPLYSNDTQTYIDCDIWDDDRLSVMTTRGCLFNCSFCYSGVYEKVCKGLGKSVRRRTVDNVIGEILMLKKVFPALRGISMADNVFTFNKRWVDEWCEKIVHTSLPYRIYSHFSMIDRGMLSKLKKSGCDMITVGFQSGSEYIRRHILDRYETNEEIINGSKIIADVGIPARYDRIENIPYELSEHKAETNSLIQALARPFILRRFYLMNHPKTKLTEMQLRDGIITQKDIEGNKGSAYKHAGKFDEYTEGGINEGILLRDLPR